MARRLEPMLAVSGRPAGPLHGWAGEPKFDGWRAMVSADADAVKVRTRRGHDVTAAVPELACAPTRDVVLDGELIVGAGRLSDFYRLAGRLAGPPRNGASERVTFAAFDVLSIDGRTLLDESYETRRAVLESLSLAEGYCVVPRYPGTDVDDLLSACEHEDMEGVVLKRLGSRYRPGERSRDWAKVKCPSWREHLERRVSHR